MKRYLLGAALVTGAGVAAVATAGPDGPAGLGANVEGGALSGFCEASAVLPWEGGYLVADNETEGALYALDGAMAGARPVPLSAEVEDIEALAVGPGGELLVVGSQSANKKGRPRPARELVMVQGHAPVRPDLSACAPCLAARGLPPKEGGLSVEGAAWWDGSLWLGVRSPLVDGDAMLLRLAGRPTEALAVTEVVPVDLGGFGVRELVPTADGLLVLAGPIDGRDAPHRLYRLATPGAAPERLPVDLPAGSEGVVETAEGFLVVTDGDGKPGEACKSPATWARVRSRGPSAAPSDAACADGSGRCG